MCVLCLQVLMHALYQVSDAMVYLVSRNVIHRDLALRSDDDMSVGKCECD